MDRDLSRSRAILISNATYSDRGIPDLPAASGCASAMARLLTGELCGWPADRVDSLQDVSAPHELARSLVNLVKGVQDVLLLYYVGHGMRTATGQLALALRESSVDPELVPHTAILYEGIVRILRGCPAVTKLVILDCCHAELGNKAHYQFQSADIDAEPVDGLYFIGASKQYEKALSPLAGNLTYFTGAFIDAVRTGIPGKPSQLTIDQIFTELRAGMLRANLPEPVQSGIRDAHHWPFARNAARPESHRDLDQEIASLLEWKAEMEARERLRRAEGAAAKTAARAESGQEAESVTLVSTVRRALSSVRGALGPVPEWWHVGPARRRPGDHRRHALQIGAVLVAALATTAAIFLAVSPGGSTRNAPGSHPSARDSTHAAPTTSSILEPAPSATFATGNIPESVAYCAGGTLAIATTASQGGDGYAYLRTPAMGNRLKPLHDPGSKGTNAVAFNPAGTLLAVADANGSTYLWNAVSGSLTTPALADPQSQGVLALAFSPDGATLAVVDENDTVYLWDVATRKRLGPLPADPGGEGVQAVAFGPDDMVAVGDYNGSVYLWNALTHAYRVLPDPGGSQVQAVAFGKGGATLAAGDVNGKTYLWRIALSAFGTVTGTLIHTLADPGSAGVEAVAFSPDGATLAVGDTNHSAYLWHVATRKLTARLHVPGETYGVSSVAFGPDGTTLAVGDHAGGAYLWHLTKPML
jgi:WD40 repeat protein